jgi:hypothetical protein
MGGMYTLSFTNPQNEGPLVLDRVIWVAKECSHHDLSIFPEMFGSGTASHPCDSGVGGGGILMPNHIVYIQLEQGSARAYRGTRDS